MITFKEFIRLQEEEGGASNIANVSGNIAKYDPIMKFKMFRRKKPLKLKST